MVPLGPDVIVVSGGIVSEGTGQQNAKIFAPCTVFIGGSPEVTIVVAIPLGL